MHRLSPPPPPPPPPPTTTRRTALFAVAIGLAACTTITPPRMVPEALGGSDRPLALRVRIGPVTGAREAFFGGAPFPSNVQVREALVATLEKAAVFAAVSPGADDAELSVSILSQDQFGMLPTTARMVANYKVAARDGTTIWSETYDTTFSSGDLGGATRTVMAQEGAVRENLKAFVEGLKARLRAP